MSNETLTIDSFARRLMHRLQIRCVIFFHFNIDGHIDGIVARMEVHPETRVTFQVLPRGHHILQKKIFKNKINKKKQA